MTPETIFDKINTHLTALATLLTAIGSLLLFKSRLFYLLDSIYKWFGRPLRIEERQKRIEEMIIKGSEDRAILTKAVEKMSYAIFNDGDNGICQQVAKLAACHSANFEASPFPAFECTSSGHTTKVNEAYRILIESWSDRHIASGRFQQTLHGELVPRYTAEFERCAKTKEDFIGVCDFKNPMTDEHRGRWRVHAPAAMIGEDDCLYVGRFIAALDDKARKIAAQEGWHIRMS